MAQDLSNQKGISLLETIISVMIVSFSMGGIFLAWYMAEHRERSLDQYWQAKQALETAYEVTVRTIRGKAVSASAIDTTGGNLSFTGTDGLNWRFFKDGGNNYLRIHNSITEVLIKDNIYFDCTNASFSYNPSQKNISVTLSVSKPAAWTGSNAGLSIKGLVHLRN